MGTFRPKNYKIRTVQALLAVLLLFLILQILGDISRQTHAEIDQLEHQQGQVSDLKPRFDDLAVQRTKSITHLPPVTIKDGRARGSKVDTAIHDMTILREVLTRMLTQVDDLASFVNNSVLPQRRGIELDLAAAGVKEEEMDALSKQLDSSLKRVLNHGAILRDDLESLEVKVKFIVNDLQFNMENVVGSAVTYLVQFKKEFDQDYKNCKTYVHLAVKNAASYVNDVIKRKRGQYADSVRSTLEVIASDLVLRRKEIEFTKQRYDKVKIQALKSLEAVVK